MSENAALGGNLRAEATGLPVKGIDIVGPLPEGAQKITVFAAGIPVSARTPGAAKAFIEWLASPAAYTAIKKSGLEPVKGK